MERLCVYVRAFQREQETEVCGCMSAWACRCPHAWSECTSATMGA